MTNIKALQKHSPCDGGHTVIWAVRPIPISTVMFEGEPGLTESFPLPVGQGPERSKSRL